MEKGQIVKIIANTFRKTEVAYRKFELGERRLYKVLKKIQYPWESRPIYKCCLISPVGKRIGSWEYYFEAADIVVHDSRAKPLGDWL